MAVLKPSKWLLWHRSVWGWGHAVCTSICATEPIAIYPALGFLAAAAALEQAYTGLKASGSSQGLAVPLYEFKKMSALMGFDWVADFDRKYRGMDDAFASQAPRS